MPRASLAHAAGLMNAGVITEDELDELAAGLQEIGQAWERGDVVVTVEDEDCHTVIERLLTEKKPGSRSEDPYRSLAQ